MGEQDNLIINRVRERFDDYFWNDLCIELLSPSKSYNCIFTVLEHALEIFTISLCGLPEAEAMKAVIDIPHLKQQAQVLPFSPS